MTARNVLFIMCDQLRHDHLGCTDHPYLRTPNIDALARRGVRFSQAFVTSGVCGPSRMSYYTGRYAASHGATWNRVPLGVGEMTLGEYLSDAGLALTLAGKTHMMPDNANIARLGIGEPIAARLRAGYFAELDRHDGHHAEPHSAYANYLRAQGYDSADPWSDYVISAQTPDGQIVSGWHMRNVHLPARVAEPHSETAYTTQQAIDFIGRAGDDPWVLHLSLVKPHWPYLRRRPITSATRRTSVCRYTGTRANSTTPIRRSRPIARRKNARISCARTSPGTCGPRIRVSSNRSTIISGGCGKR